MRWRIRTVLPEIRGYLLDVGCGTNDLVKTYQQKCSGQGIGIDVHPWEGVDLVVEDSSKLPIESESADTVTMIASLNHMENREQVLLEVRRVLRFDGRILVTMIPPEISKVWHFMRQFWDADQKERGMKEGELFGLKREQVRRLLTDSGFEILFEKRFMFGINCLTVAVKKESGLGDNRREVSL